MKAALINNRPVPLSIRGAGRSMAQYMIEEAERFENGKECLYEVTLPMLKTMA